MRHVSIETTLKYYVEQNADVLTEVIWKFSIGRFNYVAYYEMDIEL
jgi:hypothetical protein